MDLCKPVMKKYEEALGVVLGRNLDAIVVDNFSIGKQCLEVWRICIFIGSQYFKEQRAGSVTIIPLDTIVVKPVAEKYRNFCRGARLAIDCVEFDSSLFERAMLYACGNTLIVETHDIAKYINYERGQAVKCVVLDGTVFHKAGLITGGSNSSNFRKGGTKKWEEREVEAMRRQRDQLILDLKTVQSERRGNGSGILENFKESHDKLCKELDDCRNEMVGLRSG